MVQNNQIGVIPGTTGNYILSFEIVPTGIVSNYGNILHFTNGGDCCAFGNRSPGFAFYPASTRLYVAIGDSLNGNFLILGPEYQSLPLNVRTKITLECNGLDIKLTAGANVYTAKQPTVRFAGNLYVYAGDPWWPAATAELYNLEYKILPARANTGKDFQSLSCTRVCMHVLH